MMKGIELCAVGSYLPENIVDNEAFSKIVETSDEWIQTRSGIMTRHIADGESAWGMGVRAAKKALESGKIDPKEIDLILVTSVSPDYATPSLSCVIQAEIGAVNAFCIDLNCACAGFVYALDMAHRYLASDDIKTVLIVSTEMLSRILNFEDRNTCVLFGDGAGAAIVRAKEGIFASHLGADGSGAHLIFARRPTPKTPFSSKEPEKNAISEILLGDDLIYMDGREVYKFATRIMPEVIEKACEKLQLSPTQLDWIIPHQANIRIVQTAMKRLGLPMEKACMTIEHTGNTSSASCIIALDELIRAGKLSKGQLIGMAGFGAGLVYGGIIFDY